MKKFKPSILWSRKSHAKTISLSDASAAYGLTQPSRRSKPRIGDGKPSAACNKNQHSACYKLSCSCWCHTRKGEKK